MQGKAHPLNAICPYYTMFPIQFPEVALRRAQPGDWVVDPFCGRGTTNLAARLAGLNTVGIDSNPVAVALASAKLVSTSVERVMEVAEHLVQRAPVDVPTGEFWSRAYDERSLAEICALREGLVVATRTPEVEFLRALALGALHGPTPKGAPSYFSNQAPRTFSPKPAYAVRYWDERQLTPPRVNILDVLRTRAKRFLSVAAPDIEGRTVLGDSRCSSSFAGVGGVRWFVTSPPYYGMKTYLQDQWLRLWFLGGESKVDYTHPEAQLRHSSPETFAADLRSVWRNLCGVAHHEARLIVRFGGINDRSVSPRDLFRDSIADSGWKIATIRDAKPVDTGKRQQRQFGTSVRKPRPEVDAYCILSE